MQLAYIINIAIKYQRIKKNSSLLNYIFSESCLNFNSSNLLAHACLIRSIVEHSLYENELKKLGSRFGIVSIPVMVSRKVKIISLNSLLLSHIFTVNLQESALIQRLCHINSIFDLLLTSSSRISITEDNNPIGTRNTLRNPTKISEFPLQRPLIPN